MGRLFGYLRPFRGRLVGASTHAVLNKVFDLFPPLLTAWLINAITGQVDPWIEQTLGTSPGRWATETLGLSPGMAPIVFVAFLTAVIFSGESFFQWRYTLGFMRLAQDVQHRLRLDAYGRMQQREIRFFEEHRLGKTLAMLSDDVNQLERFLNTGFVQFLHLVTLIAFAGFVLFSLDAQLALIGLLPVPVIVLGSLAFSRLLESRYARVREAVGALAARLENNLGGILVIKSFTAEAYEHRRVEAASDDYRVANLRAIELSAPFIPLIRFAILIGFVSVVVMGGKWALEGRLVAGTVVAFAMMIQRILWPLTRLGETLDEYQRARASAARIFSLLTTPPRIVDDASPARLDVTRPTLAFDDVRFRYRPTEPIFDGLSFAVAAGETVGVAGPTGAGKSTLVKLLLRLYDVDEGAVRVCGEDVRRVAQTDLRHRVALVSQDVYVFHGTIADNIAYGLPDDVRDDRERVAEAARQAHLHEFVASLPEGYDTLVGERGIKLSGGQRQRLSLARALLKDAPILILDEATSSVDTETEREIQANLAELTRDRTALVIAHRLSTIRHADRILVLEGGRLAEEGHHDDLVALGGTYAGLWQVQSGEAV